MQIWWGIEVDQARAVYRNMDGLCGGIALYLFGFIRFPHDGPKGQKIPRATGPLVCSVLQPLFVGARTHQHPQRI